MQITTLENFNAIALKVAVGIIPNMVFRCGADAVEVSYEYREAEITKCLSEHPFGTIKRGLNSYFFLLKGKVIFQQLLAVFFHTLVPYENILIRFQILSSSHQYTRLQG